MQEHIEFNFVYSEDDGKVKDFIGTIPRNIDYVNYIDIVNKLTKNDFYQHKPSNEVIYSFLVKQLHAIFDKDNLDSVYYVLGDLDNETISNIKSFIESICDRDINYNIYHSSDTYIQDHEHLFKKITEFE